MKNEYIIDIGGGMPSAGSGTAQQNPGEMQTMMGMALQMEMQKAQIDNLNADTLKKKTEAKKTSGVDTEAVVQGISESQQRIKNLIAEEKNTEAKTALTKVENAMAEINRAFMEDTFEDRSNEIEWNARKAVMEYKIAANESYKVSKTVEADISKAKAESAGAWLTNKILVSTNKQIIADTNVKNETVNKIKAEVKKIMNDIELQTKGFKLENLKAQSHNIIEQIKTGLQQITTEFMTSEEQRHWNNSMELMRNMTGFLHILEMPN